VDAMVVGFEKIEEIDDFAARVRKVPAGQEISRFEIRDSNFARVAAS
jgi:hypothetical protein